MNVERIWQGIDELIAERTPQFVGLLNPPASESRIAETEAHIGMTFPPSVRLSYLVHDGESGSDGLFDMWEFLSLANVITWWTEMKQTEELYHFGDFDIHSMIPIMFCEGDLRYVDHSDGGQETPLVQWDHGDPTRDEQATTFAAFLTQFLQNFQDGKLIAEPEYDLKGIVAKPS